MYCLDGVTQWCPDKTYCVGNVTNDEVSVLRALCHAVLRCAMPCSANHKVAQRCRRGPLP